MTRSRAAAASSKIEIQISARVRESEKTPALLRRVALHVARDEGFRRGVLSIAVVGRRAMSALHERHMNIAGPTDVLTFDLGTDRKRDWIEGEIVICRDVARLAVPHGLGLRPTVRAVNCELALYVAHGILHLAGYDDRKPADFRRMHARENRLLSQLSLGEVFGKILD